MGSHPNKEDVVSFTLHLNPEGVPVSCCAAQDSNLKKL